MKNLTGNFPFERRKPLPPSLPLPLREDFLLKYREIVDQTVALRAVIMTAVGLTMHVSFSLLDRALYPAHAAFFLLLRTLIVPPSLLICLPNLFKKTKKYSIWTMDVIALLHIGTLCGMIYASDGASSNYFAGINLTLLGLAVVNGFYFWHNLAIGLISLVLYLAAVFGNQSGFDLPKLIVAATLMSATALFIGILTKFYSIQHFNAFIRNEQLEEDERKLAALYSLADERAKIDDLSKIYNRRFFFEILSAKIANSRVTADSFFLVIFDIDHFKEVNDAYGHTFGDGVIAVVARTVREKMRANSYLGRYGGDEFMLIIDRAATEDFLARISTIRTAVRNIQLLFEGTPVRISASFGAARFDPASGMDEKKLIDLADAALLEVKRTGRGEIKLANPA